MAYCIHCGVKLREGVNFCEKCGAEVSRESEEFVDELEDDGDEPEIEDCDETPEKGPPTDCYATFDGRVVSIYRENGALYHRIHMRSEVLSTQITGDRISITCEGGWHYLCTIDGAIIRSSHR